MKHTHLALYKALLSTGEERFFLARDVEDAAWEAVAIAEQFNSELIDISPHETKET
tara:strand:+ start:614 stop:781 length:168 start_codon:yes stop_codon:yes gene_type:complete